MDKPISLLIKTSLVTVHGEDSLEQVEKVLASHDLTYVPVVDAMGSTFGIITAHDLVHFHSMKKNPRTVQAWEICTHRPVEVDAHTTALDVARLMVAKRIHHVLVTKSGRLIGVVSSFDLVEKYLLDGDDAVDSPPPPKADKRHSASIPNGYTY